MKKFLSFFLNFLGVTFSIFAILILGAAPAVAKLNLEQKENKNPLPDGSEIIWLGDSYSTEAQNLIKDSFKNLELHIESGKRIAIDRGSNISGLNILKTLEVSSLKNPARPFLVFALGTNDVDVDYLELIDNFKEIETLANEKYIIFTTAYSRCSGSYETLNNLLKYLEETSENVFLADFSNSAKDDYFIKDCLHPDQGYEVWLEEIKSALKEANSIKIKKENTEKNKTKFTYLSIGE